MYLTNLRLHFFCCSSSYVFLNYNNLSSIVCRFSSPPCRLVVVFFVGNCDIIMDGGRASVCNHGW